MTMNKQVMKDILMTKDYALLQTMLKNGWDINTVLPCAEDDEPVTALYMATEHHDYSMMRELLAAGADIDRLGCKGNNALDYAVISMRLETVEFLVANGANIHLRGSGKSPHTFLDLAVDTYSLKHTNSGLPSIYTSQSEQNSRSVLEYLVSQGIEVKPASMGVTEFLTTMVNASFAAFYTSFQENAVLLKDAASVLGSDSDSTQRRAVKRL